MEAKGVAVWQPCGGDDTRGESRPAEAGCRESTGRCTRTGLGWFGGTSLQHKVKSSIHLKPSRYTRRSCAERCVFTPGDLPRVHKRTERTVRGDYRVAEVSRGHSSRWKRAVPPEREKYTRRSHPGEGPSGAQPNGLGKWSWLSKSMFLSASCNSR